MRRIVMFNRVTPEGYYASPEGSLDWAAPDEEIERRGAAGIPHTDTILFGRRTYQMFESFWPRALDDSATAPDPHAQGRRTPALRAMAEFINGAKKLVFSRSLASVS